jgi:hypothetical protein
VTAVLGRVRLTIPGDGSYGPLWIAIRSGVRIPAAPLDSGLEALEPWIELAPRAHPLRRDLAVDWTPPSVEEQGLALMRRGEGGWSFVGSRAGAGNVTGTLGLLESITLVRDTAPPIVRLLPIDASRKPRLRAAVDDGGTGVAWTELVVRLDGHPLISEWDPDAGHVTAEPREPLAPGLHTFSVEALDRAGNRAARSTTFTLR